MHPDLDRLIRLQRLDTFADGAHRTIASLPDRIQGLDDRLATARANLDAARQHQADGQAARRAAEKDLAGVQGRLSKYRDQLMEVKTNREYQAMQKEIEVAQQEVRRLEDRILERMIEADDLTAGVKLAEAALAADQAAIAAERQALEAEARKLETELERVHGEREGLLREVPPPLLETYALLIQRRGSAVGRSPRGPLLGLPRPAAYPGLQRPPAQRRHHPVRELPARPLLHRRAGRTDGRASCQLLT